jgi:DNA-binding cell septation regulator SpoVG
MKTSISDIQIHPITPRDGLVGFSSFVLNDSLFLNSIAIMTRPNGGYRLLYPTKTIGEKSIGIFHPIQAEFGKEIEQAIVNTFIQIGGEK